MRWWSGLEGDVNDAATAERGRHILIRWFHGAMISKSLEAKGGYDGCARTAHSDPVGR